jgi:hypothetical protein
MNPGHRRKRGSRAAARRRALNEAARMIDEIRDDAHDIARELGQGDGHWIRGARWIADRVRCRLVQVARHARRGP